MLAGAVESEAQGSGSHLHTHALASLQRLREVLHSDCMSSGELVGSRGMDWVSGDSLGS